MAELQPAMRARLALAVLIAAAALSACQRAPAPANTAAALSNGAPPPAPSAAAPAHAPAPTETPAAFAARVLAPYQNDGGQMWANTGTQAADQAQQAWQNKYEAETYDPAFLKIINDNRLLFDTRAGGDEPPPDPVCQCNTAGPTYSVASARPEGDRYDVVIKTDEPDQGTWTLVLARSGPTWRVDDVLDQAGASARATLTKQNACLRAAKTQSQGDKCVSS